MHDIVLSDKLRIIIINIPSNDGGRVNFSVARVLRWYERLRFPLGNQLILLLHNKTTYYESP